MIQAVLLDPLPFREPERLVRIWETRLDRNWTRAPFTHANFWDVKAGNRGMGAVLLSFDDWVTSDDLRRTIWLLACAVGVLLVIACANLTNLFAAWATGRSREQAMRAALGVSRARLVRQVLTESTIVGLAGAAAAIGLAFVLVRVIRWLDPGDIRRLAGAEIDPTALGFTLVIALATRRQGPRPRS